MVQPDHVITLPQTRKCCLCVAEGNDGHQHAVCFILGTDFDWD
ncbi:MAG: hypothetical protein ABR553_08555 [Gammaproteobacteria bacterium]